MSSKVLLVLVDGMRTDSIGQCGNPEFLDFFKSGTYSFKAQTVFPPVTLPCHISLFHSIAPNRHGITTNTFVPQIRPVKGLIELLSEHKKTSAMVYTWEQLRDICTPGGHLEYCWFERQHHGTGLYDLEHRAASEAKRMILEKSPDFLFLYLGGTDIWGHDFGWMSREYLAGVENAWSCIQEIYRDLPEDYSMIITADHGGHDRNHGENIPEDMTIPVMFRGKEFAKGLEIDGLNICDLAPTIAELLGVEPDEEWEGKSILQMTEQESI